MPKVSVVIITYNRAEFLRSAISSVLSQTFQDFELIVVDDASKDNTAGVVQAFNNKRIRYIRHETNKREAGARNTGVRNAEGEYIAFLDDDDEWLPEKLQKQVELLDKSPAAVGGIYTGFIKIDRPTGKALEQIIPTKRGDIFRDMLVQNYVGTPSTVLLRKMCFEKVGLFDEGIAFGPDYDMWFRIAKEFEFDYVKESLVNYFVHDNKLSANYKLIIEGMETINRKYDRIFTRDKKNYSDRYHRIGVFYCYTGKIGKGRKALVAAIKLYPFDIRYYFRLFLSLFGAENFKRGHEFRERLSAWVSVRQKLNDTAWRFVYDVDNFCR